ncbi:ParB/RepB/Spo0J family partition protein [Paenirhodobacter populi]|nr:ParB/RepB/Spo0J family partition protein [Sinirhodobacter populi]
MTDFPKFDARSSDTSDDLVSMPLAKLYLSPMNPRQNASDEGIAALASSIEQLGLIQPLAGMMDADGRCEIVAGGRRLRALAIAVASRPELAMVPVKVTGDRSIAAGWAAAENVMREAMNPVQEIEAFKKMRDAGNGVHDIAIAFGTSEAQIYRYLALAGLPEAVLKALAEGKINVAQASAFTISDDLTLITKVLGEACFLGMSASRIRSALRPDAILSTSRMAIFVGEEAYIAAGGGITRDLFSEECSWNDTGLAKRLFDQKLASVAEDFRKEGWHSVVVLGETNPSSFGTAGTPIYPKPVPMSDQDNERYQELFEEGETRDLTPEEEVEYDLLMDKASLEKYTDDQMSVAEISVYVDYKGEVCTSRAVIPAEMEDEAVARGVIRNRTSSAAHQTDEPQSKPAFGKALVEDIRAVKLHAFQSRLRQDPALVLRLLAYHLSGKSMFRLFDMQCQSATNLPANKDGMVADEDLVSISPTSVDDVTEDFHSFLTASEDTVKQIIADKLSRAVGFNFYSQNRGADLFTELSKGLNVSPRDVWTPTASGFWLRCTAGFIDRTFAELTGLPEDDERIKAFNRLKKGEKVAEMERLFNESAYQSAMDLREEQIEAIKTWMPNEAV